MKSALYTATILLCALSAFCSVLLWVSEQNTVEAKVLFGGFALGLELCKFAFFPMAAKLKGILSAGLYSIAFALLLLSITATVSLLETGAINNLSQARISSEIYQSERSNIESINVEIKTLQALIKEDVKNGYRARALSQGDKLAKLRSTRTQAVNILSSINVIPDSGIHSIFRSLAKLFDSNDKAVRFWVYVVLAVAIDICGIACLMLINSNAINPLRVISGEIMKSNASKSKDPNRIKQDIASGIYGDYPVMTKVMEKAGIRHPKAKEIFQQLLDDGSLMQIGRKYELAGI